MEKGSVTERARLFAAASLLAPPYQPSPLSHPLPLSHLPLAPLSPILLTPALNNASPPYSFNEREYRYVAEQVWTFERSFDVDAATTLSHAAVDLVITGLDTVADVLLNGEKIARCENAHR